MDCRLKQSLAAYVYKVTARRTCTEGGAGRVGAERWGGVGWDGVWDLGRGGLEWGGVGQGVNQRTEGGWRDDWL